MTSIAATENSATAKIAISRSDRDGTGYWYNGTEDKLIYAHKLEDRD